MSDYESYDWDFDEEIPHRRRWFTWLIVFILVCALLLPLLSPIARVVQDAFRPTPTPTLPANLV